MKRKTLKRINSFYQMVNFMMRLIGRKKILIKLLMGKIALYEYDFYIFFSFKIKHIIQQVKNIAGPAKPTGIS